MIFFDCGGRRSSALFKMNDFLYKVFETSETGIVYTDQTGRFPYRSSRGNKYIMVAYHYNANVILIEPIKIGRQLH